MVILDLYISITVIVQRIYTPIIRQFELFVKFNIKCLQFCDFNICCLYVPLSYDSPERS